VLSVGGVGVYDGPSFRILRPDRIWRYGYFRRNQIGALRFSLLARVHAIALT